MRSCFQARLQLVLVAALVPLASLASFEFANGQLNTQSDTKSASRAGPPNILIVMPDDVGYWNVGVYSHGMMVPTPNIDRLAREGMMFTDHYAQPSCTPGRAALITGQLPIRTGLTTVGMAGSPIGLDGRDPTLAEVLKAAGWSFG